MDNVTERWLPVVGYYEGFYEVSDLGRVRSVPRIKPNGQPVGRVLKPWLRRDGHLMVALKVDGKSTSFLVHRLMAIAFLGEPPPGCEVCHNDGDGTNNVLSNIRWGTRSENILDSVQHGTNHWTTRTHCPNDHEYTPENTGYSRRSSGKRFRYCKTCKHRNQRAYDSRRRSKV